MFLNVSIFIDNLAGEIFMFLDASIFIDNLSRF